MAASKGNCFGGRGKLRGAEHAGYAGHALKRRVLNALLKSVNGLG